MTDTIVIGAGLAGLSAAIRLAEAGQAVTLLTFGLGGIQLGQGTIDVLGYDGDRVERPFDTLPAYAKAHPGHPYGVLPAADVRAAVDWLAALVPEWLVPGDGANHLVPTALGALRPTYLVQPSMQWPGTGSVAVVGPHQIKDFYPLLCAANLNQAGVTAQGYAIDLPARAGEAESSPVVYATALDHPDFLKKFADAVKKVIGSEDIVCLPAILGLHNPTVHGQLVQALGRPVVEVLLPPPSIPGMRINEALTARAKAAGVRVILGSKVTGFTADGTRLTGVVLHQAGADKTYTAAHFVYAPGGFESGALALDSYGQVSETVFHLPLTGADADDLITGDYWSDQKLFAVGVSVDNHMRPVGTDSQPAYENLYTAGGLLAGAIRWTEKSGDAIAIASAVTAADAILAGTTTNHD